MALLKASWPNASSAVNTSSLQQSGGGERQRSFLWAVGTETRWLLDLDNGVPEPPEGLAVADQKRAWRGTACQRSLTPCHRESQSHLLPSHPVGQKASVLSPPTPLLLSRLLCLGPHGLKQPFQIVPSWVLGPLLPVCPTWYVHPSSCPEQPQVTIHRERNWATAKVDVQIQVRLAPNQPRSQ